MSEFDKNPAAFLPGGQTPDAQILVQTPYGRKDLASISGGADPAPLKRVDPSIGSWGLLYISDGVPGFYLPASESAMAAMFRGPNGSPPESVLVTFRRDTLVAVSFEIGKSKDRPGILGAVSRFFGLGGKDRVMIEWTQDGGATASLDFYPMRDDHDFLAAFRELDWYRETP